MSKKIIAFEKLYGSSLMSFLQHCSWKILALRISSALAEMGFCA
jgi:hypothetical protein